MPRQYSSKYIESVLIQFSFTFVSQKGSHRKYTKDDKTVIVPANQKLIPIGTFASIKRQSGLSEKYFTKNKGK